MLGGQPNHGWQLCFPHVIKYCEKVYERYGKNLFWPIKNSEKSSDKLKAKISMRPVCLLMIFLLFILLYHNLI